MHWQTIDQYEDFQLGTEIVWLSSDGVLRGSISEMAQSPEGTVFWLSCAPFWVKPEAVRHAAAHWKASSFSQPPTHP
ncbi:MAG: hypothetical protein IVW51_10730 [Thermaceae bacterium]|nr:hypothetical protein [Thermaceae bacterium]